MCRAAARLAKHGDECRDVAGRIALVAVLPGDAVVALGPVWRAGDDAVGEPARHRRENVTGVADVQGDRSLAQVEQVASPSFRGCGGCLVTLLRCALARLSRVQTRAGSNGAMEQVMRDRPRRRELRASARG